MIGHHARLREDDDLPLGRGAAVKKKPPFGLYFTQKLEQVLNLWISCQRRDSVVNWLGRLISNPEIACSSFARASKLEFFLGSSVFRLYL